MVILFPLRHDRMVVRRLPWVSIGIVALNAILFLFVTRPQRSDFTERIVRATTDVIRFRAEHPDVRTSDRLRAEMPDFAKGLEPLGPGRGTVSGDSSALIAQLMAAVTRPVRTAPTPERLAADQEEFDRLQETLLDLRASDPFRKLGYIPAHPDPMKLFTSQFVHGGWMHLIFNMLFLYLSAPFIEDAWGRVLFPVFYLAGGAVAGLAQAGQFPGSDTPLIGASGAIAAAMGAFLVRFGGARIHFFYLYLWPFPFRVGSGTFPAPAWLVLPLWLLNELWYAGLATERSGTAFLAHVAGFVFGALAAVVVRYTRFEERFVEPVVEAGTTVRADPRLDRAITIRTEGDPRRALAELSSLLSEDPGNVDAHEEAFRCALAAGDPEAARRHGLRRLELLLRAGENDLALRAHDELLEAFPGFELAVRIRFAIASLEEKSGRSVEAAETYRLVVSSAPEDPLAFRARIRLATLALADGRIDVAREELRAAASHPARRPENDAEIARLLESASRLGRSDAPMPADSPKPRKSIEITPVSVPAAAAAPKRITASLGAPAGFRIVEAVPIELGPSGIELEAEGRRLILAWPRIEVVATGLVTSNPPEAQVLLCCPASGGRVDVARLRSSTMRLPELTGRSDAPPAALFAEVVGQILSRSSAEPLPDRERALGRPFAPFAEAAALEAAAAKFLAERTVPLR